MRGMTDSQKHRRRPKWLAKVFRREDSGSFNSTPNAPKQDEQQHAANRQGPALRDSTTNQDTPITISFTKVESSDFQGSLRSPATLHSHSEARNLDENIIASADQRFKQSAVNAAAFAQTFSKLPGKGVLAAPLLPSNAFTGSNSPWNSPYKKIADAKQVKKPRLLDPTISMRSADLWEKAYFQLSTDEKHKDLFVKYEAILEENFPPSNSEIVSFPKNMEAMVQFQINKMKQKQWVLQWDQKSIVVRDQAERIVKFVQTFSSLGSAVASIDPIHAGIPWAGVCTILTVSTIVGF